MSCSSWIASFESDCFPIKHWVPGVSTLSCPSVRDVTNVGPIAFGALQNESDRTQSHAHSAYGFAGSVSPADHSGQPHDQTDAIPVSAATCLSASACHFTTWYQSAAGARPLRPPKPFVVAKLTMSPSRSGVIPRLVKSATAWRYDARSVRLPRIGPRFHVDVAGM